MSKWRIGDARKNVAAIPWLVFALAFWNAAVLCRSRAVKLALGV